MATVDSPQPLSGTHPVPVSSGPKPSISNTRSFRDILVGSSDPSPSGISASNLDVKASIYRGKPAVLLSDSSIDFLVAPFSFTLIGKFISKRPSLDAIKSFFFRLKLHEDFQIGLLDNLHISIKLKNDLDYSRIFSRRSYQVNNCWMRLLKWSPDFDIREESPVMPIWVGFPNLRLHLINPKILHTLGSILGRPLQTDLATASLSRPSMARVLVEMDITKKFPSDIWIGTESNGYFQKVIVEDLPSFCSHCRIHGHSSFECFVLHPELKKKGLPQDPLSRVNAILADKEIYKEKDDASLLTNCESDILPGMNNSMMNVSSSRFSPDFLFPKSNAIYTAPSPLDSSNIPEKGYLVNFEQDIVKPNVSSTNRDLRRVSFIEHTVNSEIDCDVINDEDIVVDILNTVEDEEIDPNITTASIFDSSDMQAPQNEEEISEAIPTISDLSSLDKPIASLSKKKGKFINSKVGEDSSSALLHFTA